MRRASLFPHVVFLIAAASAPQLQAQSQATTGVIRGMVRDPGGQPVPGVSVRLRARSTNVERRVGTNDAGYFVATLLPVGIWDVSAEPVSQTLGKATREGLQVRLGETLQIELMLQPLQLDALVAAATPPSLDATRTEIAMRLDRETVTRLPSDGRNYLGFVLLSPAATIVQGPDGDELSIAGQRGIHNNISVDGADFNNPFFGEQRGGQRPAFTFNLDAVQEIVVVSQGAHAEFGRSSGGFVNVLTRSGTNELRGSAHYFGKDDALSADMHHQGRTVLSDFRQHQFGITAGGPIKRDRAFFFLAYDHQDYHSLRQQTRPSSAAFDSLRAWTDTAFAGALSGDFGSIRRTNDADALIAKVNWIASAAHGFSLKYNYTRSRQINGTFDVDTWGRSANAIERDRSHAINGSLASQLTPVIANEFRFQYAVEDRPREYSGPLIPGTGRPFPDTGLDFVNGFRFGLPFFIPVEEQDRRLQLIDNISWSHRGHLFKAGIEWNRTSVKDVFVGFANGRFIFNSVTGFQNYVRNGNGYVECSNGPPRTDGQCPGGEITGPVLLYLQQGGVGGRSVVDAGTQAFAQNEIGLFVQDSWIASPRVAIHYGVRWEAQIQPAPLTPPDQTFFAPYIGTTVTNQEGTFSFPSDGTFPSDRAMLQPRLGIAWDMMGDGRHLARANTGIYFARTPGLLVANIRSTNGSVGQSMFRNSELTGVLGPPPNYDELLPVPDGVPFRPAVMVFDRDYRNPRTISSSLEYQREITDRLAAQLSYTYARTDFLTRFIDRNDAVFGRPWSTGLEPGGANGIGTLTVAESSARSRYHGVTLQVMGAAARNVQFQANYTLSFDRSDDDNERDPFSFRYARADRLDREFGWSDRDQRHRLNTWLLASLPAGIDLDQRLSWYTAQPMSESCGPAGSGTGRRAASPADRICSDGSILQRNTLRRDNAYFSWDMRATRSFAAPAYGRVEAMVELFNVLNNDNFRDPSPSSLLFNFDGTVRSGLGDPRQVQAGLRWTF